MSHIVAVYGSLKRGFYNNRVFPHGSEYVQDYIVEGKYKMVSLGGYPGIVSAPNSNYKVMTELWRVPNLDSLDVLEGNGYFYTREVIETPLGLTWIYVLPDSYNRNSEVEGGVWKD